MKVSACLIAKNEELNIGRCLSSLKGLADEIIVVDTGSEDRTIEIAKSHGARVYHHPWENDFSKPRNYAIDQAAGDWIIFLDADEYFADKHSLNNAKKYMEEYLRKDVDAFFCRIVNIDTDPDKPQISTAINLRIFRNNPNLRYRYEIHEEIFHRNRKLKMVVLNDEVDIMHTGYSDNIVEKKIKRNLEYILKDIAENGEDKRHYHYLVDCYYGLDQYDEVIKYAKLHLEKGDFLFCNQNKVYEKMITAMSSTKHDFSEIKQVIDEAIHHFPQDPMFHFQYAFIHMRIGAQDIALSYLLKALELHHNRNSIDADSFVNKISAAYMFIGNIYHNMNNDEAAAEAYIQSLNAYPYNSLSFKALYELLRTAPEAEVISLFNRFYSRKKKNDMEFVVRELGNCPLNKVYFYYQRILTEEFNENPLMDRERALISAGKYDVLAAENDVSIRVNTLLLSVTLVAAEAERAALECQAILPRDYAAIVLASFDRKVRLTADHFDAYAMMLKELLKLKSSQVMKFVKCADSFSGEQKRQIAEQLIEYRRFEEAIVLYQSILFSGNPDDAQDLTYLLGRCYYFMGEYKEASARFNILIQSGCKRRDVAQLNAWCQDHLRAG